MKTLAGFINLLTLVMAAQVVQAQTVYKTIDDFNTGLQTIDPLPSGRRVDFQSGSMIGGLRQIAYQVGDIEPATSLGRKGVYAINKGHLIVEEGVHVASRLEISYGIGRDNSIVPLNLNLSRVLTNGQFALHFHSLDMINQVDVILQVVNQAGEMFQFGKQVIPPVVGKFDIYLPIADFRSNSTGNPPLESDLTSISYITLIFQEAGNGGTDYAVDSFDISTH
jgi:hypothetical protein